MNLIKSVCLLCNRPTPPNPAFACCAARCAPGAPMRSAAAPPAWGQNGQAWRRRRRGLPRSCGKPPLQRQRVERDNVSQDIMMSLFDSYCILILHALQCKNCVCIYVNTSRCNYIHCYLLTMHKSRTQIKDSWIAFGSNISSASTNSSSAVGFEVRPVASYLARALASDSTWYRPTVSGSPSWLNKK